jgi:hypothetical protein
VGQNENVESIKVGKAALKGLGFRFPTKVNLVHVLRKLFRVPRLLAKKSDREILSLPRIANWRKIRIQQLLVHVTSLAVQRDNENEGLFSALAVVKQSMIEGLSVFSEVGFSDYALEQRWLLIERNGLIGMDSLR